MQPTAPPAKSGTDAALVIEGPSFPVAIKALATLTVLALIWWGLRAQDRLPDAQPQGAALLLAALLVVAAGYWTIMRSRTRIDGENIEQRGLWTRRVRLREVTQVKLVQIPGLGWIVVPRLVVKAPGLHVAVFYAGNAPLRAAFRLLAHGTVASTPHPLPQPEPAAKPMGAPSTGSTVR